MGFPAQWKREARSPEFHQIAVVNGSKEWRKNEGDYFPEWLREISVALIEPVPSLEEVLKKVEESDVHNLMGVRHFSWMIMSTDGNVEKGMGAGLAVRDLSKAEAALDGVGGLKTTNSFMVAWWREWSAQERQR